jgi:hypothetical protein
VGDYISQLEREYHAAVADLAARTNYKSWN